MVNGLQVARGEAIRRNLPVKLVLELPTGWTVCEASVEPCDATTLVADPLKVIQARSSGEGTGNAEAKQTPDNTVAVTFSPLGNVMLKNLDESLPLTRVDFFNTRNACIADSGPLRCLRVVVNAGGSIRMCDPSPGIVFPDTRACP
jgi:type IV fimbrial biogenesis protein FimT